MAAISQPLAGGQPSVASQPPAELAVPIGKRFLRVTRRLLLLAVIALFIRAFIGEAALVPTSSMEGTILVGDHILLNKLAYGPKIPFTSVHLPRLKKAGRGEIIAFNYPKDPSLTFLKRVAAVGGDVVEIRDDILYVNRMPVREAYAVFAPRWKRHPETMRAVAVPRGHLFVLGDNRDNSDDSRFWGTVPEENVIGEPLMVLWSYDAPSKLWLEEDPARVASFYTSIAANLFTGTRWWRTGIIL